MRRRTAGPAASVLVAASLLAACTGADAPSAGPAAEPDVVGIAVGRDTVSVAAAGDIARNPGNGRGTADLIGGMRPDAVLALGDLAYQDGSAAEFRENYEPTWGAFKAITRPIPGNHEYGTKDATGYFDYFRSQIGGRPYYAWDAGRWRMYALNCDIECGSDSPQLAWLREDLARHRGTPALAYVHEPLYTCSTRHPPARRVDDIWKTLQEAGGQLLLSGNNHAYERFAALDAKGAPSPNGMRQFVVGTGGVSLYPLVNPCEHREAQVDSAMGVLQLELRADAYSWRFVAVDGRVLDEGSQAVRAAG